MLHLNDAGLAAAMDCSALRVVAITLGSLSHRAVRSNRSSSTPAGQWKQQAPHQGRQSTPAYQTRCSQHFTLTEGLTFHL